MKTLKRFSVFFFAVLILSFSIPFDAFAFDPISAYAASQAMANFANVYGMYYGVQTTYDVSNINSGVDTFNDLWSDYNSDRSSRGLSPISVTDAYNIVNGDNIAVTTVDDLASNPPSGFDPPFREGAFISNWTAFYYSADASALLDDFWNWALTGPAEMQRSDDSYFHFRAANSGPDGVPLNICFVSGVPMAGPLPTTTKSSCPQDGLLLVATSTWLYKAGAEGTSDWFVGSVYNSETGATSLHYISTSPRSHVYHSRGNATYSNYPSGTTVDGNVLYIYTDTLASSITIISNNVPSFNSRDDVIAAFISSVLGGGNVSDTIGVRGYDDDGICTLPDTNALDYVAEAIAVPIDVLPGTTWGDVFPLPSSVIPTAMDDIFDTTVDESLDIAEEKTDDPEPTPPITDIVPPLIPVGLPSFNFSFSGIWHYVREWVTSLAAWFSTMFSVWNSLPYAMVVPVYATMVIVIVLGVYKRFFM